MSVPPYAIEALSHNAEIFREAAQSVLSGTGVISAADFVVTQAGTPNMSVNVAAGQIWIPGTLSSTAGFPANSSAQTAYGLPSTLNEQGSYYAWNNGTVNLAIATASPSNPRIDIVCASIQDAAYSGSTNTAVLQVITGTPAASPSPPSAPASSVVIAQVLVPTSASSIVTADITDERPFTTATFNGTLVASGDGPTGGTQVINTTTNILSVAVPLLSGQKYLVTGSIFCTVITSAPTFVNATITDSGTYVATNYIMSYGSTSYTVGSILCGAGTLGFTAGATGTDTLHLSVTSSGAGAGVEFFGANQCTLFVTRVG